MAFTEKVKEMTWAELRQVSKEGTPEQVVLAQAEIARRLESMYA